MTIKSFDKINYGNVTISIITMLISIFALVKSCITDKKLEETNYLISSIEYRPRLKCSNPEVVSFKINMDPIPLKGLKNSSDTIGNIFADITLKLKIKVKNIGNNTAKISGWVITDSLSELDIIRPKLFNLPGNNSLTSDDKSIFPHYSQEISPQDSSFIEFEYTIQNFSERGFIIHILLLYDNELQQLFDTYYWINYNLDDLLFKSSDFIKDGSFDISKLTQKINGTVSLKSDNNYSETYSKKRRDKVIREFSHK